MNAYRKVLEDGTEIYIFPYLRPAAFCLISLVETPTARPSSLPLGQCLIQAYSAISALLEHASSKNPTWVISPSQSSHRLPGCPAAWEGSKTCPMRILLMVEPCLQFVHQNLSRQCSSGSTVWFAARLGLPSEMCGNEFPLGQLHLQQKTDGAWGKHFHNEAERQSISKDAGAPVY